MKKNIRNMLIILLTCMSCLTISYLKASAADSFQTIKSDSYLNTVGSSSVKLPDAFKKKQIDGISLVYNDKFIPIDAVVNKNIITITPSEYLKNKKTYYLRIFTSDDGQYELKLKAYDLKSIDFSKRTVVLIPPKPEKGFNFPYYLVIQKDMDKSKYKRLMVETNNTGRPSDVLAVHQESAYNTAISGSVGGYVAEVLKMPMLVPVFPRPLTDWWDNYYHTLPRVVMQKTSGDGQRIDLQLIAMIEDARELLDSHGLYDVRVEMTPGHLTDHYDPRSRVLRLSRDVYHSTSLAALGVAAHETGHALQHAQNYVPLGIRNNLFPVAHFGSQMAFPLFFLGFLFGGPLLMDIGIMLFAAALLFQVVTLPVEYNASSRAMQLLEVGGYLAPDEAPKAKSVLSAAALTYLAATAMAVLQLIRLLVLRGHRDRR